MPSRRNSVKYTVYSIQYTVYSVQYTVYIMQYTLFSVQYTVYSIRYTVKSIDALSKERSRATDHLPLTAYGLYVTLAT